MFLLFPVVQCQKQYTSKAIIRLSYKLIGKKSTAFLLYAAKEPVKLHFHALKKQDISGGPPQPG